MSLITVAAWRADLGSWDCETCGYSCEEIEITREEGQSLFEAFYRVGCYGGGSLDEAVALPELKAWLDAELSDMDEYKQVRDDLFARLDANTPDDVEEWG